jgi:hypothetical protein
MGAAAPPQSTRDVWVKAPRISANTRQTLLVAEMIADPDENSAQIIHKAKKRHTDT